MNKNYGKPPTVVGTFDLSDDWHEFMHYLYLPVRMKEDYVIKYPENLGFLFDPLLDALDDWNCASGSLDTTSYIYATARRGVATRDNPLNRPGWHCDDFGGTDYNYVWSDKYPTRFLTHSYWANGVLDIPNDHIESITAFEWLAANAGKRGYEALSVITYPPNTLLRLDPYVIHATPDITDGGGMRSFFKFSFSNKKYNLLGNSHNYLFDYNWKMHDRQVVRNDPSYAGTDYFEES